MLWNAGCVRSEIPYDFHGSIKTVEAAESYIVNCMWKKLGQEEEWTVYWKQRIMYIYIFELKLDSTAAEALQQIEDKGYAKPYLTDTCKVTGIGISFSSETMTVEEWEEKHCNPVVIK
ncbi:hypothetical protein HMPREF1063_00272 [Phocaeicola dorei CL02T00C15]|uniref:Uncharacterized protein n=1 Tax=Phocaeicola dorei CL02T12C06 TaxID=997876 RepID=I9FYP2_9BACT|nr:hypothetical protein HMPREF1063_00272 [Phocaeicola dorei CL02T00C15]EIY39044.1 hypothetical protein HMPREF1064_00591 [Phocaeicola dorei CL02T12C06]